MRAQFALGGLDVEVPVGAPGERRFRTAGQLLRVAEDDLGRTDAFECRRQLLNADFGNAEFAARQVEPGEAGERTCTLARGGQGQQEYVALVVEQRGVGQRARGDDARHGAFDRPLARRRVADLLADDH